MTYKLTYKAFRGSVRDYVITGDKTSIFFAKAALDANHWHVVGVEEVSDERQAG